MCGEYIKLDIMSFSALSSYAVNIYHTRSYVFFCTVNNAIYQVTNITWCYAHMSLLFSSKMPFSCSCVNKIWIHWMCCGWFILGLVSDGCYSSVLTRKSTLFRCSNCSAELEHLVNHREVSSQPLKCHRSRAESCKVQQEKKRRL